MWLALLLCVGSSLLKLGGDALVEGVVVTNDPVRIIDVVVIMGPFVAAYVVVLGGVFRDLWRDFRRR